jgi:hypothetical protein
VAAFWLFAVENGLKVENYSARSDEIEWNSISSNNYDDANYE